MDEDTNCSESTSNIYLYAGVSIVWLGLLVVWDLNSRHYNVNYVNALHKMIGATVLLKFLLTFFSFMARISCSSKTFSEYWILAEGCTFCLFNTFLFVTFLLISKGFCYTREYFDRDEINIMAITTGGIYIVFSIYLMQAGWLISLILVTVSYMWFVTNKNSKGMIKTLDNKILHMRRHNLLSSLPAVEKKLKMIKLFSNLFQVYMTIYIIECIWDCIIKYNQDYSKFIVFLSLGELNDFFILFGVCVIFWPRYNGQFFDLAEFEVANENRVPIEMHESDGKGIDALNETDQDQIFLLRQPYTDNNDYSNYLVALPISIKYHQEYESNLEEPLLARPLT